MNAVKIKEGFKGIANEVLADVQKEAEVLVHKAKEESKETLRIAKDESDNIYAIVMAEVVAKASFEMKKIDTKADVDVRNQILVAKDALMQSTFEKAQSRLNQVVNEDKYKKFLLKLIEESAKKIGSEKLIVIINSRDKLWLTQKNIDIISKRLRVDLALADETTSSMGGCKIQTIDGNIIYDNTFENRLEQLKPALRPELAKILFQIEGSPNVS
jgi:V/A-type H+/Na+-transporting ATPase subunit E